MESEEGRRESCGEGEEAARRRRRVKEVKTGGGRERRRRGRELRSRQEEEDVKREERKEKGAEVAVRTIHMQQASPQPCCSCCDGWPPGGLALAPSSL